MCSRSVEELLVKRIETMREPLSKVSIEWHVINLVDNGIIDTEAETREKQTKLMDTKIKASI